MVYRNRVYNISKKGKGRTRKDRLRNTYKAGYNAGLRTGFRDGKRSSRQKMRNSYNAGYQQAANAYTRKQRTGSFRVKPR